MSDGWFEGEGRTDAERRFLAVLRERAGSWAALDVTPQDTQAWTDREPLCLHVDLVDATHRAVVGTLRVEFDGRRAAGGWSDGQLVHALDPAAPDFFCTPLGPPNAVAGQAADWLESQLRRPIDRREWQQAHSVIYREWVLADDERGLSAQYGPRSRLADAPTSTMETVRLRPDRRIQPPAPAANSDSAPRPPLESSVADH